MSIWNRIKNGFSLQEQSSTLLLRNPRLFLYWLIPFLIPPPSYIPFIVWLIPNIFIDAAFILHMQHILSHKTTHFKDMVHTLLRLSPWLLIWTIFVLLAGNDKPSDLYKISPIFFTVIIAWRIVQFYGLVILVVDKINPFTALCRSVKTLIVRFFETITGWLSLQLVLFILSFGIAGIVYLIKLFNMRATTGYPPEFSDIPDTYFTPALILSAILGSLIEFLFLAFKVKLYTWHIKKES